MEISFNRDTLQTFTDNEIGKIQPLAEPAKKGTLLSRLIQFLGLSKKSPDPARNNPAILQTNTAAMQNTAAMLSMKVLETFDAVTAHPENYSTAEVRAAAELLTDCITSVNDQISALNNSDEFKATELKMLEIHQKAIAQLFYLSTYEAKEPGFLDGPFAKAATAAGGALASAAATVAIQHAPQLLQMGMNALAQSAGGEPSIPARPVGYYGDSFSSTDHFLNTGRNAHVDWQLDPSLESGELVLPGGYQNLPMS